MKTSHVDGVTTVPHGPGVHRHERVRLPALADTLVSRRAARPRLASFYAEHFDTVELNNPFYRLPDARVFSAWRQAVPPGFIFAVKASRYLTHMRKLTDPADPLRRLLTRARRLGDTLGPILFQLPGNFGVNLPRLDRFLATLGRQPCGGRYVLSSLDPGVVPWLPPAGSP